LDANSATFPPAFPMAPFELLVRARDVVRDRELDGLDELLRPRELPDRELVLLDLLDAPFRLVDLLDVDPLRFERVLDDREREDRVVCAMVIASLGFRASSAIRAGGESGLTRCAEDLNGCKMIWNCLASVFEPRYSGKRRTPACVARRRGQDAPAKVQIPQQEPLRQLQGLFK
jgi:hypothetical protein